MKSTITQLLKHEVALHVKEAMFPVDANTYMAIGRPIRWGDEVDPELSTEIENAVYSTVYRNQVFRDMIAIKKVQTADTALVVPRIDWVTGIHYDAYTDQVDLASHLETLALGTGDLTSAGTLITQNTARFSGNVSTGNLIYISSPQDGYKEIVSTGANTITVNSNMVGEGGTYLNVALIRIVNTYPQFANNFYVRNSKDQVFKCLFNNHDGASTIEPTIDIDGQLPENPYILTGDSYKWKYLYTIPYGMKQKFFTASWMPAIVDNAVVAGAVDGRLDIITINSGGTGYFLEGGESGNSNSLSIITVTGDGEGAIVTAKVQSGVITDLNILNGGTGYTTANVTITAGANHVANGNIASFSAIISPPGGHGSNPVTELGCYSVMTAVDFIGTETDTIPVGTSVVPFDFRQITLLSDPKLANGVYANASVYRMTTKLSLTDPGTSNYTNDETVYIGSSLALANMTATVVNWDSSTNELYVNNLAGNVVVGSTLTGNTSAATATILGETAPNISLFTGELLYIENRAKIVRDVDQTEQIRLVLSF